MEPLTIIAALMIAFTNTPATVAVKSVESPDSAAIVAIVISMLAVLFAFISARAAKKANIISVHGYKLDIFSAFHELSLQMGQTVENTEKAEVQKFLVHRRNAEIYFSKNLFLRISEYTDLCFYIVDLPKKQSLLTPKEKKKLKKGKKIISKSTHQLRLDIIKELQEVTK
ncbi:TPA: hypothetical protein PXN49_004123 [Yersinia enterocolitica]|nr:hypothetical protein [Yersinia enterocolitica]